MHLKSFASEISITALLARALVATMAWLRLLMPDNATTSVHVFNGTMAPFSSGSGIGNSLSSSSCASASKCDTIKWPECMISFSCLSAIFALFRSADDVGVGGDGADADVNQLSRNKCDTPCAILFVSKVLVYVVSLSTTLIKSTQNE